MQSSPDLQGFALPAVVNPADSVCIQIPVPNDPGHIAAFIGVLYDLTLWTSWQRDPDHLGVQAAQVWKQIWNNIVNQSEFGNCPDTTVSTGEMDYDMTICEQLRFNPATGLFEGLCCAIWTPISGQPAQGLLAGQPGAGAPVPSGGQCQVYQARLNASDQWLCPAPVNAGDTVQVTVMSGGWSDGAGWYCPNGGAYFAGICGPTSLNGADPLPTQPHMALLTKINGVYHNISDEVLFTVPGGVSNKLLIFQANDASLSDNSGQIYFEVTVCNNQPATWSSTLDFTIAPYTNDTSGSGVAPVWQAGVGWLFTAPWTASSQVAVNFSASNITSVVTTSTASGFSTPTANHIRRLGPTVDINNPWISGNGLQTVSAFFPAGQSMTGVNWSLGNTAGAGTATLLKMVITGTGTKPAGLP